MRYVSSINMSNAFGQNECVIGFSLECIKIAHALQLTRKYFIQRGWTKLNLTEKDKIAQILDMIGQD